MAQVGRVNGMTALVMVEGRKQTDLRRFCEETEMKNGDIVVLRIGTTEIYGVGVVGQ